MIETCRRCGDEFKRGKKNQVFCSSVCQVNFHREYANRICSQCGLVHPTVTMSSRACIHCTYLDTVRHELAMIGERAKWLTMRGICFYCGEYGCEIEHVVPQHTRLPTYTVLACRECNGMAGGELFANVLDKLHYIRGRREKKYAKVLSMPQWTKDELKDLGYAIRVRIEACENARQLVQSQLDWFPLLENEDL